MDGLRLDGYCVEGWEGEFLVMWVGWMGGAKTLSGWQYRSNKQEMKSLGWGEMWMLGGCERAGWAGKV